MTEQIKPPEHHEEQDPHEMEGEEAPPPLVNLMAAVRWTLLGGMTLAAAASVAYVAGVFDPPASEKKADKIWTCSMHPQIRQDQPGECPICGMDLVPVDGSAVASVDVGAAPTPATGHEEHGPAPGGDAAVRGLVPVQITPERQQLIGVRTARVERTQLAPTIRTVGFVSADESRIAHAHTKVSGWIEDLLVTTTGEYVRAHQPMARIYSPEYLQAEQEYLNAFGAQGTPGADALLQSARRRLQLLDATPADIEELERSGRPLRHFTIRAHASGYVLAKNALHGMYVQPGTELFMVVNLGAVWVLADVYEQEIALVKKGQKAALTTAAFPGQVFRGRVQFLYPTVAADTRTLKVRLEFPNPGLKLRPGMYGDVEIQLEARDGLTVPAEAVIDTGTENYVFIARGGGTFEPRAVAVGRRNGNRLQILSGLDGGEEVVTSAAFLIDSESRLRAAMQGMGRVQTGGHEGHGAVASDGGAP
jgi:Cu(I)/Ag(I) efflux system membrane fusion protein